MATAIKYGVGGIFFLLPFFVNPVTTDFYQMLEPPKLMACFLFGNLLFSFYLAKKFHCSFAFLPAVFAAGVWATGFGAVQLYPYVYMIVAVFAALWFIEQKEETRLFIFRAITLSGSVLAVYAIFQKFNLDPIFSYAPGIDPTHPIGTMGQTTKFGAFIATIAVLAFAIRDYPAAVLCFIAALLTGSSFTALGLFAGLLINLRRVFGRPITLGTVLLALFGGYALYSWNPHAHIFTPNGREKVWAAVIDAWWNGPQLLGFGPGAFGELFSVHFQPKELAYGSFKQAHNDYLEIPFAFGWMGIVFFLGLFISILRKFYTLWWNDRYGTKVRDGALAGLAALMANALGNFPWQLAPHYFFGIIFMAVILERDEGII